MNVVLLGHYPPGYQLAYYFDWRDAFLALPPPYRVRVLDTFRPMRRPRPLWERLPLAWSLPVRDLRALYAGEIPCDVLVLPPSFFYFHRGRAERLLRDLAAAGPRRFATVFMMENEFRLLEEKVELAGALHADVLTSQFAEDVARRLYGRHFRGKVVSCPPGLNPDVFRPTRPLAERTIHLGTRSHLYPAELGDTERNDLLRRVQRAEGPLAGLRIDVSFEAKDRFPREEWARFLNDCRATVSTETGSVELRLYRDPETAVSGKVPSSRHFEALGTRTAQVMFGGRFNGLFRAGEHYLELKRDFSNLREVCERILDVSSLERLTAGAYEWARAGHTYAHRVRSLLAQV